MREDNPLLDLCITADELERMQSSMPVMIESMKMYAALVKVKFDSLKDLGFTDEQALYLCRG